MTTPTKMQVLYVEQTGHIMAAFTRNGSPEALLDVNALAGANVVARNFINLAGPGPGTDRGESLPVPIELLKAAVIDYNPDALAMPCNFMVGGGQANDLRTASQPLASKIDEISMIVQLVSPVVEETKVWVQIQEKPPIFGVEPIQRIMTGSIPLPNLAANPAIDGKTVKLDFKPRPTELQASLPNGDYYVFVLVAGMAPGFTNFSIP